MGNVGSCFRNFFCGVWGTVPFGDCSAKAAGEQQALAAAVSRKTPPGLGGFDAVYRRLTRRYGRSICSRVRSAADGHRRFALPGRGCFGCQRIWAQSHRRGMVSLAQSDRCTDGFVAANPLLSSLIWMAVDSPENPLPKAKTTGSILPNRRFVERAAAVLGRKKPNLQSKIRLLVRLNRPDVLF